MHITSNCAFSLKESIIDCLKIHKLVTVDRPFRNPRCSLERILSQKDDILILIHLENNFWNIEILDKGR